MTLSVKLSRISLPSQDLLFLLWCNIFHRSWQPGPEVTIIMARWQRLSPLIASVFSSRSAPRLLLLAPLLAAIGPAAPAHLYLPSSAPEAQWHGPIVQSDQTSDKADPGTAGEWQDIDFGGKKSWLNHWLMTAESLLIDPDCFLRGKDIHFCQVRWDLVPLSCFNWWLTGRSPSTWLHQGGKSPSGDLTEWSHF